VTQEERVSRLFRCWFDPSSDPLARPHDERQRERRERLIDRRLEEPTPVALAWVRAGKNEQKRIARRAWDELGVDQRGRARPTRGMMAQHQARVFKLLRAMTTDAS
jgi:hypothetical protein